MLEIDNKFISKLLSEAAENPRLRQNYDLRTSYDDNSQRMLNALTSTPLSLTIKPNKELRHFVSLFRN